MSTFILTFGRFNLFLIQFLKDGEFMSKQSSEFVESTPVVSPNTDLIQKKSVDIVENIPGIIPHDKLGEMFPDLKFEKGASKGVEVFT